MLDRERDIFRKLLLGTKIYLHTGEYDDGKIGKYLSYKQRGELVKALMNNL